MRNALVAVGALFLCSVCVAAGQEGSERVIDEGKARLFWDPAPIDEPLIADRPDFTESTDAVPLGRFQIEVGYTYTKEGDADTHNAPELLLRVGMFEGVELRIAWPNFTTIDAPGADIDGLDDLNLGVKVKLVEQDGLIPHFGVIGELSIPTGADDLTSDGVDPALKLLWAYDLSDRVSVAGNINFASVSEDDERFFQGAASLALGVALTDRVGAYLEYFGFYPASDGAGPAHTLNGGVTYLIHNNLQLDARVGFGLNGRADDFFTGVGFAVRF